MTKMRGVNLSGALNDLIHYIEYDLTLDIEYIVLYMILPAVLAGFLVWGSLGFLGDIYRLLVPPDAPELHRSALAALHHQKRIPQRPEVNYKEAEQLLLKAIAKDDLYAPAYLCLAALYIYRMKLPDEALVILEQAKDRAPHHKIEPLKLDAEALKMGGNEHMIQAGGALFAEQEYLTTTQRYDKLT